MICERCHRGSFYSYLKDNQRICQDCYTENKLACAGGISENDYKESDFVQVLKEDLEKLKKMRQDKMTHGDYADACFILEEFENKYLGKEG